MRQKYNFSKFYNVIFTQHKGTVKNHLLHIKDWKFHKKEIYNICTINFAYFISTNSCNKKKYNNCKCFFSNCILIFC